MNISENTALFYASEPLHMLVHLPKIHPPYHHHHPLSSSLFGYIWLFKISTCYLFREYIPDKQPLQPHTWPYPPKLTSGCNTKWFHGFLHAPPTYNTAMAYNGCIIQLLLGCKPCSVRMVPQWSFMYQFYQQMMTAVSYYKPVTAVKMGALQKELYL